MMDKTAKWLYAAEQDGGGISAWNDGGKWHEPYLEVSGYLLPTMLEWHLYDLAKRTADWLVKQQNHDGSWNGLDGVPRPFDTAMVMEGLSAMYDFCGSKMYKRAADNAKAWMIELITPDGYLPNSPVAQNAEIYNLRASAIIGNGRELEYWKKQTSKYERSHYLAYMLEGALRLGAVDFIKPTLDMIYRNYPSLIPYYIHTDWTDDVFDFCATAQFGILFVKTGFDAERYYRAVLPHIAANGGVPQSTNDSRQIAWGAKFWLDFQKALK